MQFYDIAHQTALHGHLWRQLGFAKIGIAESDVRLSLPGAKGIEGSICVGVAGEALNAAAKQSPKAVMITDSKIDRKLLDTLKAKNVILCISLDRILSSVGLRRSSAIYLTSKLVQYAIKRGIKTTFVSFAGTEEMLCSPVQIIEIARLLGAEEGYARTAISETNAELIK